MIEFLSHIGVSSSYSIITANIQSHETEVIATTSNPAREHGSDVALQTQNLPRKTSGTRPTTAISPGRGSEPDSDSDTSDSEPESANPPLWPITPHVAQANDDDLPGDLPSQPARSSDDMWARFQDAAAAQAVEDQAPGRPDEHRALTASIVDTLRELRRADEERLQVANIGQDSPEKSHAVVGLLKRLSDSCNHAARAKASKHVLAFMYDNINILFCVAEARMDATGKDALQNGTCATAFALYNAESEAMLTSDYLLSFVRAPPLSLHDMLLTPSEIQAFTDLLRHTVLSIIVNHGGPAFTCFKPAVDPSASRTTVDCKIPVHTTEVFPLPTMEIDESTIIDNAKVVESMFSAIGLDMASESFMRTVKLIAGDQLSIARLRALTRNRAGHDSFANLYIWAVVIPGIFHYKMAATHGFMELHYGQNSSPGNPGSLAFHNNLLNCKPIVLTSLPHSENHTT